MERKDLITLEKMLGYSKSVVGFCSNINSSKDFFADEKTKMACAFALIQIGELSNDGLSDDLKKSITTLPWNQIKGLRNRIVHGYDNLDDNIIWQTIKEDMPSLIEEIEKVLARKDL